MLFALLGRHADYDRRRAGRVHLAEHGTRDLARQQEQHLGADAGVQPFDELCRRGGRRVQEERRGLVRRPAVEETRHLFGVLPDVLGVQRSQRVDFSRRGRHRTRTHRTEARDRAGLVHRRSMPNEQGPDVSMRCEC